LRSYPADQIRLFPDDGHFSRLGHQLVAQQLARYLDEHKAYRSSHRFRNHPVLLGDLRPNSDEIRDIHAVLPYKVITNDQGLRMEYELTFPKTRQRVLILGDSYTFGPYLPNPHVYPNMLDREDPDREIVNAGIMGYTISDELRLFREKAKYVEPDIVVLQVYSNDVLDLSSLKRQSMGMKDEVSDVEVELLKIFKDRISQQISQES
jgi:lysophospholipase L1-like esterase